MDHTRLSSLYHPLRILAFHARLIVLWWDARLMGLAYPAGMSFVRKPRPYSSGLPSAPLSAPRAPRVPKEKAPRPARPRGPRSSWAGAVTALAGLGALLVLVVGLSGLWNAVARDWQFRSAAAGVLDVVR